jgi:peptidoglycan-associated lipoprotein
MKLTTLAKFLALGLIVTAGCKKTPVGETRIPDYKKNQVSDAPPTQPFDPNAKPDNALSGTPISDPSIREKWVRNAEVFQHDTVHFDYDSTVIKASEKPKVAEVADYLKGHPEDALEIDGHCDERGTEEYNRALGERRALALREELAKLGVDPMKIDTKTFGKDRPVDTANTDAAHAKNRRGEFLLETPPTASK